MSVSTRCGLSSALRTLFFFATTDRAVSESQVSPGKFRADLDFAQVNGIFLTHERWSRRVAAIGATPSGYLVIAGVCTERTMSWSGAQIDARNVVTGLDATDIELVTPEGAEHWVAHVPIDLMVGHLGEQLAAELLPSGRSLTSDPRVIRQLGSLVVRVVAKLRDNRSSYASDLLLNAIQSQLMRAITELLVSTDGNADLATPRRRFLACQRALRYAEQLDHPIGVDELAAKACVSRRTLELGFKESYDISPQRYLRHVRLNGLHRDLRHTSPERSTITEASRRWGFVELGRTAVEYRKLFGECPSTTLAGDGRIDCRRYADALTLSSSSVGSRSV